MEVVGVSLFPSIPLGWVKCCSQGAVGQCLPASPAGRNSTHSTATSRAETHHALQKPSEASSCPLLCTENTTTPCTIQLNRLHSFATSLCSAFTFSLAHLVHLAPGMDKCSSPTRRRKARVRTFHSLCSSVPGFPPPLM